MGITQTLLEFFIKFKVALQRRETINTKHVEKHDDVLKIFYWAKALVLYTRRAPPARIPASVTAQIANPVTPPLYTSPPGDHSSSL